MRHAVLAVLGLSAALAGCGDLKPSGFAASGAAPAQARSAARSVPAISADGVVGHLQAGVSLLRKGELEAASAEFNRGLKYDPQHALLNYLNAHVYHWMARSGNAAQGDLAEVGYRLALQFDPTLRPAAIQLANLYLERRSWRAAQNEFSRALLLEPDDPGALYGLAYASYYAGDPATARGALARLPAKASSHPEVSRARALVAAALHDTKEAQGQLAAYASAEADARRTGQLTRRIAQWDERYAQLLQVDPPAVVPPVAPADAAPATGAPAGRETMVILDCIIIRREEVVSSRRGSICWTGCNSSSPAHCSTIRGPRATTPSIRRRAPRNAARHAATPCRFPR